jgi:hypothetical protein
VALVLQSALHPTAVLFTLVSLADNTVEEFRCAVAYMSYSGCLELFPRFEQRIGPAKWKHIPKAIVTSFDFGFTEPRALEYARSIPNLELRVARSNLGPSGTVRLIPPEANFHPKIYVFQKPTVYVGVVGSANLSGRAFTANTEAVTVLRMPRTAGAESWWTEVLVDSLPLTDAILESYTAAYRSARRSRKRPPDPDPPIEPIPSPVASELARLADAIDEGYVDPLAFSAMWVQAGSMPSGGSRNQLELPRGAQRFFGFQFDAYAEGRVVPIGPVTLRHGMRSWDDRPLRWHGDNQMERLNLPTRTQGGFTYTRTAILFRRLDSGFEVEVAPWDGDVAIAWRNASTEGGTLFRVGRTAATRRICGFF